VDVPRQLALPKVILNEAVRNIFWRLAPLKNFILLPKVTKVFLHNLILFGQPHLKFYFATFSGESLFTQPPRMKNQNGKSLPSAP
jgi:hypothetical protein